MDFNGTVDGATSVALSGSKIIAAGYTDARFAILSLNSNGSVDSSFGVGTGRSESGVNELPQAPTPWRFSPTARSWSPARAAGTSVSGG